MKETTKKRKKAMKGMQEAVRQAVGLDGRANVSDIRTGQAGL